MARKSKIEELDAIKPRNKSVYDVKEECNRGYANLIDFNHHKQVSIRWGMNEKSVADQVFILKIGSEEAYLSSEDIMRYLRWV